MDYLTEHPNEPFRFVGLETAGHLLTMLGVATDIPRPTMFDDHFTHWIFAKYSEEKGYNIVCLPKSRTMYEQAKRLFHNFENDPAAMTIQEVFIAHWRRN